MSFNLQDWIDSMGSTYPDEHLGQIAHHVAKLITSEIFSELDHYFENLIDGEKPGFKTDLCIESDDYNRIKKKFGVD